MPGPAKKKSPAKKSPAKKKPAVAAAPKKRMTRTHATKIAAESANELPLQQQPQMQLPPQQVPLQQQPQLPFQQQPQQQMQQHQHQHGKPPRIEESEELRQCRREAYMKYLSKCNGPCMEELKGDCVSSSVDQFHRLVIDTMNAGQMKNTMNAWPVDKLWDRENPLPTNAMGPKGKKVLHEYRRCINNKVRATPEFDKQYQKQCGKFMTA